MLLTALVFGVTGDADENAILLPVLGQSLFAYQIRCALAAGAQNLILYSDRLPLALLNEVNKLSREGIKIAIARSAPEVGDLLHPDEHVLFIAPHIAAAPEIFQTMLASPQCCLVTLPDVPQNHEFELIDATARWSGLALVSAEMVRSISAGLGDWALDSTLLRRALQSGVERIRVDTSTSEAPLIAYISSLSSASHFNQARTARCEVGLTTAFERWISQPLARRLLPLVFSLHVPLWALFMTMAGMLALMLFSALMGWHVLALLSFIVTGLLLPILRMFCTLGLRAAKHVDWLAIARLVAGGVLLMAMVLHWSEAGEGSGAAILGFWVLIEMVRNSWYDPWYMGRKPYPLWGATPDGIAFILVASVLAGLSLAGLVLATGYVVVTSFLLVQSERS